MTTSSFAIQPVGNLHILRLISPDGTNRLTRACVLALTGAVRNLMNQAKPLIITGNEKFFSAGADLFEIAALQAPEAYQFAGMGQTLMNLIEAFPAPVYAAVNGYCMGGALDLALACHHRVASPHAIFAHRGAALGLVTVGAGPNACHVCSAKAEPCKCSPVPTSCMLTKPYKSDWLKPW